MLLENLGWGFIGVISGSLIYAFGALLKDNTQRLLAYRRKRKFERFLERFNSSVRQDIFGRQQTTQTTPNEISELTFRDKDGQLCTVQIVVDHSMNAMPSDDEMSKIMDMVKDGQDELSVIKNIIPEEDMRKVQKFIFPYDVILQMKASGLEPDEVVRKMLQASGRIA